MSGMRKIQVGRMQRVALLVGAAGMVAGGIAAATGSSQAAEDCGGLDTALQNNLTFIAGQRADPDSLSQARIVNREAVVDLLQQRRQAAGCTAAVTVRPRVQEQAAQDSTQAGPASPATPETAVGSPAAGAAQATRAAAGEVVCSGSTVTLSGEGGAPAASSNQFPPGTRLTVTNLDNQRSITVRVTGVSGSCVLLNDAAFEQVRESGRFLIRRARIERVR